MNLGEKLALEIPGIVGWMIEGAKRLIANNYQLTIPKASAKIINKFDQEMSSAAMFVFEENWNISDDRDNFIVRNELYDMYKDWSLAAGKKAMSRNRFYDDLEMVFPNLEKIQRRVNSLPKWCFNLIQNKEVIPEGLGAEGVEIIESDISFIISENKEQVNLPSLN
jgi:putative DNA primase/helicase